MANEVKAGEGKKRKRKDKEVAIFGNYRHYYGYRVCKDMKADPRLMVLKKEWLEDKDCLDIGCNQGLITIEIAKTFHCQSILGVDIDASLVESAYWNLKKNDKLESAGSPSPDVSEPEHLERTQDLEHRDGVSSEEGKRNHPKSLLDIVSFQKQNFVEHFRKHSDDEKYDAVTCFSVTKWIHLNWGDEGLITLFRNIWRLLRPGGILVLEPQPWKSYKSNYLVSETATLNYHNIVFHPCWFQEILLDKIGFRTVESCTSSLPGSAAGFNRPLFAFRK
ncbi:hypothetical protein C5167_037311 [Papaver somniferum]|uniref:RNA methyltransferase n=1 Tax=Papaver somniferum TaxID=3469 RepID=A0A4Y7IAD2_PAPSO|nr:probable RNA methyltransferase At5g51130 [Papaver somniferum]XP_026431467.1 probable RNA methyltransferase At5g51130 [Papaver somniferum]XP_026431469.1 probable RNA methyltransferase At5g51130 [Papaver somniferum]RZC44359.1 hypothetical protein C5167_037311 [Papaver somniferum]